jgi:pyridoxine 4-dehydrogenase
MLDRLPWLQCYFRSLHLRRGILLGQYVQALRGSLRRLGQDQVAVAQLHWSTARYAPLQERALWDGLAAMYDEGLCKAVGVSNYGPQQLLKIYAYLERRGIPLASVQVQFSLISKGPQQQVIIYSPCNNTG